MNVDHHPIKNVPEKTPQKRESPPATPSSPRGGDLLKGRFKFDFIQGAGFIGGPAPRRKGRTLAMWSLMAAFIDILVVISFSCLFLVAGSLMLRSSVVTLNQMNSLIAVVLMLAWVYMVTARSFVGFSLGEWACGLRLGQPQERMQVSYVLRVSLRCLLILATGVILLPFLSLITGKDIAGILSGVRLFSLK